MTTRFPFASSGPRPRDPIQRRGWPCRSARDSRDIGFTLIELLIVMLIAPLIIGTITLAFFASSKIEVKTNDQLSASGDAQAVSSTFTRDFQSAAFFTTDPSPTGPTPCGGGPQVVGMEWPLNTDETSLEVISYTLTNPNTTGSPSPLRRYNCTYDTTTGSLTSVGSELLSGNVVPNSSGSIDMTVSGQSCNLSICSFGPVWQAGWVSTTGISALKIDLNEKATQTSLVDASCSTAGLAYCFTLSAVPRTWSSSGVSSPLSAVELLGNAVLQGCNSNPPNFYVNGTLVVNSPGPPPTITGDAIYPTSVQYYQPPGGTSLAPAYIGSPGGVIGALPSQPLPSETAFTPQVSNPFATLHAPAISSTILSAPPISTAGVAYAYPGTYQSLDSGPNETLILRPGVYVVEGDLDHHGGIITTFPVNGVNGGPETPGGAMIYVTNGGSISLSGLDIGAPTNGYYAGIALWQDTLDTSAMTLSGSSPTVIDGLLYGPNATITPNGTASMALGNILTSGINCNGGGGTTKGNYFVHYTQLITVSNALPANFSLSQPTVNPVNIVATGGNSNNPVTFSVDPQSSMGACTSSGAYGATITFLQIGTCLIDANQAYGYGTLDSTQIKYLDAPTVQLATQVGP